MEYGKLKVLKNASQGFLGVTDVYEYKTESLMDCTGKSAGDANKTTILVFIPKENKPFNLSIEGKKFSEELFVISGQEVQFDFSGEATLLTVTSNLFITGVNTYSSDDVKKVVKPWGYELWITGNRTDGICLKKIRINAGTKTSLQYHEFKRETNYLHDGQMNLFYNKTSKSASEVTLSDIDKVKLDSPSSVHVESNLVHRIEAVADVTLYEVSTPELDDVIRIQDDSGRADGRISSEH